MPLFIPPSHNLKPFAATEYLWKFITAKENNVKGFL